MSQTVTLSVAAATRLSIDLFVSLGMSEADAAASVWPLIDAETMGIATHGLIRVPAYARRLGLGGIDAAGKIVKDGERSGALLKIAAVQSKMNQQAAAMVSFDRARQIAQGIDTLNQKANLLIDLALALSAAGEQAQARQALDEAESVAKKILDRAFKKEVLKRIRETKGKIHA